MPALRGEDCRCPAKHLAVGLAGVGDYSNVRGVGRPAVLVGWRVAVGDLQQKHFSWRLFGANVAELNRPRLNMFEVYDA